MSTMMLVLWHCYKRMVVTVASGDCAECPPIPEVARMKVSVCACVYMYMCICVCTHVQYMYVIDVFTLCVC